MPSNPQRALALLRVSTEAQAGEERAGLPAQRAEVERIAAAHDLDVVEWIELRGVSGAQVLEDARFRHLLERLGEPDIAGLICADFDRLFRRGRFGDFAVLDAFVDTGSLIWTSEGTIDPRQETDGLLSVLRGELAGMERRRIALRTARAKEALRRQGRHVSGDEALPYAVGYDKAEARWYYKPAEAQVVREVFRRVLAGERNFAALARDLGVGRTLVHKILSQTLYKGVRRVAHRYPGKRRVPRAPGDVIEQRVLDPPLIDPADWEAAQAALHRPAPPRGVSPLAYVGFAVCSRCGGRLSAHRESRGGWTYRCRSGCLQLVSRVLDSAADAAILEHLARPAVLAEVIEAAMAAKRSPEPFTAEDLEREAKRLLEERERILLAFERGLRGLTETERRTRELDASLARVDRARQQSPEPEADPMTLAAELAAPFVEWPYLTVSQKRRILQAGVESLRVERPQRATARILSVALRVATSAPRRAPWADCGGVLVIPCHTSAP